jgi:FecR-like protein
MRNRSSRSAARVLLAVLLLTLSELALAAVGKVLFVSGPVTLERGGSRTLNKGDTLEAGDVVVTGEKARAQILMADGAKIALRSGSRFRIDEFALPQAVNAPSQAAVVSTDGRSVSSLLKGGFRTTTGSVGKVDRNAYEVRTPIGTLGIRGTDYAAVFCAGDCTDVPGMAAGAPIRDGLYLGVYEGSIAFTSGGQVLQLNQGDFVFIPLAGARPEPLQTPPAFLEEDGAGRITLGSAGGARPAASSAQLDDFNERRSPTGGAEESKDERKEGSDVSQPVIGTTPNGTPVDLTGGDAPRPRGQISYNLGAPGPVPGFTAVSTSDADTFVRDANGNVTAFAGLFPAGGGASVAASYQIGTSANTNTGSNAATGLSWGRWSSGTATIVAGGTTLNPSLAQQSLHWIAGTPFDLDPVLPVSGTRSYVVVGATSPTDTRGNVGVLGAASLDADFTQQTISTAVVFDLDGRTWFATGSGGFGGASGNSVSATFTRVEVSGLLLGNGTLSGFFSEPTTGGPTASGFGLSFSLTDSALQLGTASGVIAFQLGAGQPVAPPALQNRDVAFAILQLPQVPTGTIGTLTNPPGAAYTVDASFNLTQLAGILPTDPVDVATYNIGTATLAEGGVDAVTVLRWGRWSGGDITVTGLATGQTFTQSLAQQSLHWIETGNLAAPPVMPTSGTATYILVGSTNPTDALGNVGVLGSATFSADFTAQTVDSALDLTLAGNNWLVSGRGSIGAQANLQPHQFSGAYNGTINGTLPAFGSYTGFFSQPGATVPGVPGGAGLSYTLSDGQGVFSATGVAVFRGP